MSTLQILVDASYVSTKLPQLADHSGACMFGCLYRYCTRSPGVPVSMHSAVQHSIDRYSSVPLTTSQCTVSWEMFAICCGTESSHAGVMEQGGKFPSCNFLHAIMPSISHYLHIFFLKNPMNSCDTFHRPPSLTEVWSPQSSVLVSSMLQTQDERSSTTCRVAERTTTGGMTISWRTACYET